MLKSFHDFYHIENLAIFACSKYVQYGCYNYDKIT
jgi:hypothetical protein